MSNHLLEPESADPRVSVKTGTNLARDLFVFNGRIRRQKYWLMGMVIGLTSVALAVGVSLLSAVIAFPSGNLQTAVVVSIAMSWIGGIAVWWMNLAVCAKRWHDRGKSGWWSLLLLIPIIGWVWVLVELGFLKGDCGDNRYGNEDVSSAETVAKWTFWVSLGFAAVLFSVGTWVGSRDELIGGWGAVLYAIHARYVAHTIGLLFGLVGSIIIWLMSRR